VARTLNETRRLAAQALAEQVSRIADELALDHPEWATPVDRKRLRGVPCVGRGISGAVAETKPGWNLFFDDRE
jgi:hypothetical protein